MSRNRAATAAEEEEEEEEEEEAEDLDFFFRPPPSSFCSPSEVTEAKDSFNEFPTSRLRFCSCTSPASISSSRPMYRVSRCAGAARGGGAGRAWGLVDIG